MIQCGENGTQRFCDKRSSFGLNVRLQRSTIVFLDSTADLDTFFFRLII